MHEMQSTATGVTRSVVCVSVWLCVRHKSELSCAEMADLTKKPLGLMHEGRGSSEGGHVLVHC